MRLRSAVIALSTAAFLVSATAPTAHAATKSAADKAGDVQRVLTGGEVDNKGPQELKDAADVRSLTVVHGKTVTLRFRVTNLRKGQNVGAYARLQTDAGDLYTISGVKDGAGMDTWMNSDSGGSTTCASLKAIADPAKDTVTLKLSRACIGAPASFRFGGGIAVLTKNAAYVDDALRQGHAPFSPDGFKIGTRTVAFG